jgi:hypothetical protein
MAERISNFVLCIMAIFVCCAGCMSESRLAGNLSDMLERYDWQSYVGDGVGVWVSIDKQELMLISSGDIGVRRRPMARAMSLIPARLRLVGTLSGLKLVMNLKWGRC